MFVMKKNEIMPFASTQMDLESIITSGASQIEKDKYMISLICGILKNGGHEHINKTETDSWTQKANLGLPKWKVRRKG